MKISTIILAVTALLGASAALGATPAGSSTTFLSGGYGYPGWYGGYSYGCGGGTAFQGFTCGVGRVIESAGDYNLNSSQALTTLTEAQRREMENLQKWTETYFDMRRMNREARTAERGPRPTAADLVRYAQIGKPQRLSPSDLDAVTGRISWPRLLQAAGFAPQRAALQEVFSHRASSGVIDVDEYLRVYRLAAFMLDDLRARIRDVPPYDYLVARRFLESLTYEARLLVG